MVRSLVIGPGNTFFSGSSDHTIRSWNTATTEQQWMCQWADEVQALSTFGEILYAGVRSQDALKVAATTGNVMPEVVNGTAPISIAGLDAATLYLEPPSSCFKFAD